MTIKMLNSYDHLSAKDKALVENWYFQTVYRLVNYFETVDNLKVILNNDAQYNFNLSFKSAKHWFGLRRPWVSRITDKQTGRVVKNDNLDVANKYQKWTNDLNSGARDFATFSAFWDWNLSHGFRFQELVDLGFLNNLTDLYWKLQAVDALLNLLQQASKIDSLMNTPLKIVYNSWLKNLYSLAKRNGSVPFLDRNTALKRASFVLFTKELMLIVGSGQENGDPVKRDHVKRIISVVGLNNLDYEALNFAASKGKIRVIKYYPQLIVGKPTLDQAQKQ